MKGNIINFMQVQNTYEKYIKYNYKNMNLKNIVL